MNEWIQKQEVINIIKSDSKYYSKEIKKAARGIYQIYTQLLNAGFDSNIAIDIMIAMISVTKKEMTLRKEIMRTLNEVIKDMTIIYDRDCSICEHTLSCNQKEGECVEKNALYYLKKFQEVKEQERKKEEKFNKLFKETYLSFPDFMDLIMN